MASSSMRIRKLDEVRLAVVVFDDNKRWIHTDRLEMGREARTVYQSRAVETFTREDLCRGVDALWAITDILVNQTLKEQQALFR